MTKKDFFKVFIKCIGLFSAINAVLSLIPNISYSQGNFSLTLLLNFWIIFFMLLIAYVLIFNTERIISILRLSKGFDSDVISFGDVNEKSFMRYGILFLGLYLIADSFPNFLYYTYLWFKRQISANGLSENIGYMLDYNWWTITGLSVLLGFVMITNSKRISKWLISN